MTTTVSEQLGQWAMSSPRASSSCTGTGKSAHCRRTAEGHTSGLAWRTAFLDYQHAVDHDSVTPAAFPLIPGFASWDCYRQLVNTTPAAAVGPGRKLDAAHHGNLEEVAAGAAVREGVELLVPVHVLNLDFIIVRHVCCRWRSCAPLN